MDVLDASHFEVIKRFILERPWWEFKLSKNNDLWYIVLINQNDLGPFSAMPFIHHSLGEALKLASIWVGEQFAIQERETEAVSICETPSNSETLGSEVRCEHNDWETEGEIFCGKCGEDMRPVEHQTMFE